jgi:hypothetical protein
MMPGPGYPAWSLVIAIQNVSIQPGTVTVTRAAARDGDRDRDAAAARPVCPGESSTVTVRVYYMANFKLTRRPWQ